MRRWTHKVGQPGSGGSSEAVVVHGRPHRLPWLMDEGDCSRLKDAETILEKMPSSRIHKIGNCLEVKDSFDNLVI